MVFAGGVVIGLLGDEGIFVDLVLLGVEGVVVDLTVVGGMELFV